MVAGAAQRQTKPDRAKGRADLRAGGRSDPPVLGSDSGQGKEGQAQILIK